MGARTWGLGRYAEAAGSIILLRTRHRAGRRARGQVVEAGSCRGTWVAGAWSLGRECIGTSRWAYEVRGGLNSALAARFEVLREVRAGIRSWEQSERAAARSLSLDF